MIKFQDLLRAMKEYYEKKYKDKRTANATEMEKCPKIVVLHTEETLSSKYNYNFLYEKAQPVHGTYWNDVKVTKRGMDGVFGCKISNLKQAPPLKRQNLLEEDGYKVLTFLKNNNHPNILNIFDFFLCGDKFFLFHELIPEILDTYVEARGKLAEFRARQIAHDVGEGLLFLHSNAISHRNLHERSVFIDRVNRVAKLGNFEFCKIYWLPEKQQVKPFKPVHSNSSPYIAPEEKQSAPYDVNKSDIWMWGALVSYMLCSEYPPSSDFEKFRISKLSSVSEECVKLLNRCLEQSPSARPDMYDILSDAWFEVYTTVISNPESIVVHDY
ncbi:testis-specific serine/threonine-protein kinase 2-like protein [Dinothrombium tinctorium]|uniref:Testis-specific serine/threonine-protein kinase 2-like protein n=1 Tax=Dinothrombium tinctorium TaxID=1965070 RepID=A0A3S4QYR8_9ACAR|nr:testis-specific serine/threonine-protein kinase 2-like protein [Dinothrombium tinctorium]